MLRSGTFRDGVVFYGVQRVSLLCVCASKSYSMPTVKHTLSDKRLVRVSECRFGKSFCCDRGPVQRSGWSVEMERS